MALYECPGDGSSEFIQNEIRKKMKESREKPCDCSKHAVKGKPEGIIVRDEVLYQHGKYKSNVVPFKLKHK